jgi:hypothetical protein
MKGRWAAANSHRGGQPALYHRNITRRQMPVEVRDVPVQLQAVMSGQRGQVNPRPGDHDHPQPGHEPLRGRVGRHGAAQQAGSGAGAADRHQADLLIAPAAELRADRGPVGDLGGIVAAYIGRAPGWPWSRTRRTGNIHLEIQPTKDTGTTVHGRRAERNPIIQDVLLRAPGWAAALALETQGYSG